MIKIRRQRDNKEIEFQDAKEANDFCCKDGDEYYLVSIDGNTFNTVSEQPKIKYGYSSTYNLTNGYNTGLNCYCFNRCLCQRI